MAKEIYVRIKKNDLGRLAKAAPDKADAAIRALAEEGVNIAKMLIHDSPPTGRKYTRGSRVHIASAPGEAPRSDMGNLINAIYQEPRKKAERAIVAATEYAVHLEFGNTRGMAARPFFGPMARQLEDKVEAVFDEFLE